MAERLIIAGGGLSGVLAAVAVKQARPDLDIALFEAGPQLGGDHTWSFYDTDLSRAGKALVEPLIAHKWSGYDTIFDEFSRSFSTAYRSITSASLHRGAMERISQHVHFDSPIAAVDEDGVTLADGTREEGDAVIDARGATRLDGVALRWQKFFGQEVRLSAPHGLTRPVIMDASVAQVEGYRFVYLLPFTDDTLLIEDTYYTDIRKVERDVLRERIAQYAAGRGWTIAEVLREEQGCLPLALSSDVERLWASAAPPGSAAPIGLRAGLFHPVTSYSLPVAVRTALEIAGLRGELTTERLRTTMEAFTRKHFRQTSFDRLLNRMLFMACPAEDRHRVLARFHTHPQALIERFYAGALSKSYQFRVLASRPPVPFFAAVKVVPERAAFSSHLQPSL
ncbi:MAG: lycopene beta-cyclase CrtY [Pseudomonadota bacterium]